MRTKDNLMLEEYKILNEGSKQYFDFAYRIMSMAIVFFTTTFLFGLKEDEGEFTRRILFLYIIPVSGYVFGLLYFYCFSALAKLGYNIVCVEKKLKKRGLNGSIMDNKAYKKGYILSYGTSFMAFLILPLVSILMAAKGDIINKSFSELITLELKNIILYLVSIGLNVIYWVFSVLIFVEIGKLMKKTNSC